MSTLKTARRSTTWWIRPILLTLIMFAAIAAGVSPHFNRPVAALSSDIVISQVYGGGGNALAPYKADYVELFNRGSSPASLNGWSIQYAGSTSDIWSKTDLPNVLLQPGQYYLIQQSTEGVNGVSLPAPDLVASPAVGMAAGAGKVALVDNQTLFTAVMCPSAGIVDFIGYGGANCSEANHDAPALTNTTAAFRNDESCAETDDNTADFTAAAPDPRNTATSLNSCYPDTAIDSNPTDPSNDANPSFTFSSADVGSTFECDLDGGGWATCTNPQSYTGLTDGSRTFSVRATNTRGNTDTTPATYTWLIDTAPPDTTIDSNPTDPSASANASFTFSASEAGTFQCRLDGGSWAACTSPQNYTGLSDGSHTFDVQATDTAGNIDPTPATYTWLIDTAPPPDTTPPETTIDSSPSNPSASANASFTFSASEAGTFECNLDNTGWAACTSPKNYTGLADGSHTFEVRATDAVANTDLTPATYTWLIDTAPPPDTTPPETTIDSSPSNPSASANASFTFSANEVGSTFECRLDGGSWTTCTSPQAYTGLADGSHTFEVRATDAAANTDLTPASYTWLIDTPPPPAASILVSAQAAGNIGPLSFGSEDILRWDGSAWSVWFDGSAAGLSASRARHNINAFWTPDPNGAEVIMSFAQNRRSVPGPVEPVDGMDLVRWDGALFTLYFDGSDVGLTSKTQEKIDALHILPGGMSPINGGNCLAYLLVSTQGPGKVPNHSGGQLKFGGEDVLGFCATALGDVTAGLWHMVLDGVDEGMPKNSLVDLSASDDGQVLYLTTRGTFIVDAAAGGHSVVYRFDRGTGLFSGPYFSAPAAGLSERLDGLQVVGSLP